ncbi:MFS transporter, DHA2 family, multidrug resistance protein [Flavobacterium aquidurense]|uniref:MFS transporter n=1 Tax=Flavobacterium frigidimaris TaxID=262320 RepID=A0ABX4BJN5_FLAFR|nr:DHA2 family efflux MFS transporter permease subunit [Flavobacterium frigidimaris]OXA75120.1 MFS transporter [Flavobacterium frigidimaris]SDY50464.1 MFS transporter, DHA2 family, multidrug resistance protein [Flavobacterium aquidurense]
MTSLQRKLLIFTVILAAIMELIDISIVNVALSHMSGNLGATLEDTSWVITAYAIANVIIIPITSFLSANLGRRNYYIGSIILFTFCSFMCGHSSNIWMLVFFRFLQGIGGGALLSISQVVVFELFPKDKQSTAGALFGAGIFIGPTIGPTLGGYITENYDWPWIFLINIPIGILVAISCYFLLKEPPVKPEISKVDWTGIALLAIGVGALQTVLERGEVEDWFETRYIIVLTAIAIVTLLAFIYWELKIDKPVVNLRVLKSKSLSIAAILTFVTGFGMFISIYISPVVAQRLLSFSPYQTGLLLLPGALFALVALKLCGTLLQKGVSPVIIIATGFLLFIYFNWRMSGISLDTSALEVATALIFRALGLALLTVPLTMLAVSSLDDKDVGQGAALNNMMRQLGGSFGVSIINTYIAHRYAEHRNVLISNVTPDNAKAMDRINAYISYFQHRGFAYNEARAKALKLMENIVTKQSSLLSYRDAFFLVGLFFALTLPLLLLVMSKSKKPKTNIILSDH